MSETLNKIRRGKLPLDFSWNSELYPSSPIPITIPPEPLPRQIERTQIVSECLRDGLHGVPEYPAVTKMLDYVGALHELGINDITVGIFPGEGNKVDRSIKSLLGGMRDEYPNVNPIVLCLAREDSLKWTADCKQINPNLNAIVFMGTAPSRLLVEGWDQEYILNQLAWAVKEATVKHEIDVIGATEHTTQTPPDFLRKIVKTQVNNGAKIFCISDTIGIARPIGTYRIVRFVRDILNEMGANDVLIDWHGHRDTGHGLANAMTAISAGADRIHAVARGIGERAGNTPLEGILVNSTNILDEAGMNNPWKIEKLSEILDMYSQIVNNPSPIHGVLAERAFTTSLGIHTAAMLKAEQLAMEAREAGDFELADKLEAMSGTIYSAIDPKSIGREHQITISPWSAASTVRLAYLARGGDPELLADRTINNILNTAKGLGRELSGDELERLFNNH